MGHSVAQRENKRDEQLMQLQLQSPDETAQLTLIAKMIEFGKRLAAGESLANLKSERVVLAQAHAQTKAKRNLSDLSSAGVRVMLLGSRCMIQKYQKLTNNLCLQLLIFPRSELETEIPGFSGPN